MGSSLRILKLCYEFPPIGGGGAKVANILVEHTIAAGHKVDLITMGFGDAPRMERRGNLTIYRVNCGRRRHEICYPHEMALYVRRALPLAIGLARKNRYSLNHTHFLLPDGIIAYGVKRATGLKYVVTTHGSDVPGYNPDRFTLLHRLLRPIWRRVAAGAAAIVSPSHYLERLLVQASDPQATVIIPNGIDVGRFSARAERKNRILAVSRMLPRKGLQYLIEALTGLEHDYEVCIAGSGPYLGILQRSAERNGVNVRFLGHVGNRTPEFKELLESASIFVFTSSHENFPIVLLEAMTAGLAIITSDATGCREVVADTAIKVPVGDPRAIRTALQRLIADESLRNRLGRAARQRVETYFTNDQVGLRYLDLYRKYGGTAENGANAVPAPDMQEPGAR